MIARMHYNALRFYFEDGWDRGTLSLGLVAGDLYATKEYLQLSPTTRGHFDLTWLRTIVTTVYLQTGAIASTKEREVCLKYFSQVGLFEHGELAGVRR